MCVCVLFVWLFGCLVLSTLCDGETWLLFTQCIPLFLLDDTRITSSHTCTRCYAQACKCGVTLRPLSATHHSDRCVQTSEISKTSGACCATKTITVINLIKSASSSRRDGRLPSTVYGLASCLTPMVPAVSRFGLAVRR